MNIIARKACELIEDKESFVLATIISHSGSTPRTAGSKMIVTADGRGIGTIGGGLLEAGVMSRSVKLIQAGQSAVVPFDLSFENVNSMDMICGGQAEVLLDCIRPTPADAAVFQDWQRLLDRGQSGWLLTVVRHTDGTEARTGHCLATATGELIGEWPLTDSEREEALQTVAGTSSMVTLPIEGGFLLIEPAQPICSVYLFGAGHVALSTAVTAAMVGFRVSVADDREAFANRKRFPDAHEIRVLDNFERALEETAVGEMDYIVILTRGHLHDKTVLAQALRTDAGYIGMIGSRKKRDAIYGALKAEGVSQADIDRVHSPIGLTIGAETPEEIAVSIVAEMIRHRAAKKK
jgi:xanthine dehydrogenase accessory factor